VKIHLWSKLVEVDETVRARIERRLRFRFDRFSPRIVRVKVWIKDLNGPRGGADKVCAIDVRLRPMGVLFVEDVAEDVLVAADRASERVARSISRAIKCMRNLERTPGAAQDQSAATISNPVKYS